MFKTKLEVDRHVDNCLKKINNETERNLRCFSFAKLYCNVGDYEQACRYVSSYLSVKPKSAEGHQLLGKCLEKLGKKEAALEAYRNSLQIDSKQNNLVIKVCELLSSDDVNMDQSGARYFCDLAQSFDPNNPAVFSLRERLITTDSDNPVEVSQMLLKELENRPTDVNLRIRLLKHFLQNNSIKEAYKHASAIEEKNLSIFHNSLSWYETFAEVLVRFQRELSFSSQLNWEFWFLSVSVLDRLAALSLDEHSDNVKSSNEYLTTIFNFDQMISKASQNISGCSDRQLVLAFLSHYHAQLYFHIATLIFKQAKKDLIQFKEAANIALPVLFSAYHTIPPDLQSMWLVHSSETTRKLVQHWHKSASFRCSQTGHILLAAAKDRKSIVIDKATQFSTGMWREQIFKKLFVQRDQQLKMSTSYFVSSGQPLEPLIRLPDTADLLKYDEIAQLVYPDSLHHYIWIGLYNNLSDLNIQSFDGLQYSIKNLNNCAAETLNVLDVQAFIYCATLCTKSKSENNRHLIYYIQDRPSVLPASVTENLGTLNQSKFITAAYKMYKNEPDSNMGDLRLLLIKGIEVIRCVGHHGLDVKLLVHLAEIFEERAKNLTKQSEIDFNTARAELYWKTALPMLEKIKNNQMITYSSNRLFEYKSKEITIPEAIAFIERGKLFTATQLMKKKDYEKALHMFEQLKDPYASFHQSQVYKLMADQKTSQNKENVTSEMRSQNIILLSRARDCLYLTLDRLREPSVDRSHPLNAQLGSEIEKIERLLSRIDPDCNNRNECDGMSDENGSSENSVGEQYVTTYMNQSSFQNGHQSKLDAHNNHSTPLRLGVARQEARPSPERLDAQIRQMAASRDAALTGIFEQNKIIAESHRGLLEELRSFKDAVNNLTSTVEDLKSMKRGFEEIKDIKKSVDELKHSVDDLQSVVDVVQELKKELSDLKKDQPKANQLSDEDLYVLDPDYGVDYNIGANVGGYGTNVANLFPNYPQPRMPNPNPLSAYGQAGLYPGFYPGLAYAYGALGLPQPGTLPFTGESQNPPIVPPIATSFPPSNFGQSAMTQSHSTSVGLGVSLLTGQALSSQTPISALPKTTPSATITGQISFPAIAPASTGSALKAAPPVNVVITSSDPLPSMKKPTTAQPVLSVTIPPQHIKGGAAKAAATIASTMTPAAAVASVTSTAAKPQTPTFSSITSKFPPLASNLSLKETKNISLGEQIEKTLEKSFNSSNVSNVSADVSKESVEEYDPCPDFKPIVPLPDEVPINTGEENEKVLFCERAKLFRHVNNNGVKEWKERGVGNLKILHNPEMGKVRILMRRDQIHKICANHFIAEDMSVTPMAQNDRAYIWAAPDFADEEVVKETFCVRFKTALEAGKFKQAFEDAKKLIGTTKKLDKAATKNEAPKTKPKETPKSTPNIETPKSAAQTGPTLGGFVFTSTPTFKPAEIAKEVTKVVEVKESPKSSPFSNFTFTGASQDGSLFKPAEASTFTPLVISLDLTKPPNDEDDAEEFVPTAEFKPVIELPDLVEVKTGEENSEVLFEGRAKLFRYDAAGDAKEWKERGVGVIKVLKDDMIRLLMRRDQVHKVCCNHAVLKNMSFKINSSNPRAVFWHAQDFSDGVLTPETFTVRFKTEEQASQFLQTLQTAQTSLGEDNKVSGKHHKPETRPRTTSFGDKFKPVKGSWECKNCYIVNDGKTNQCVACDTPKSGTSGNKTGESGPGFSFGLKTPEAKPSAGFSFGQKPATDSWGNAFKPPEGSWECKICYIRNSSDKAKCASCETPKEGTAGTPGKPALKGVNLDTPGLNFSFGTPSSKAQATKVDTIKPLAKSEGLSVGFGDAFKPKIGSWECRECLVRNNAEMLYCQSCDTPKDDSVPKKEANKGIDLSTPGQTFTFGMPASSTAQLSFGSSSSAQLSFGAGAMPPATTFKPPTSDTFNFKAAGQQQPADESKFVFGSPQKHDFEFKAKSPRRISSGQGDEESDGSYVEEEEDNIYFKPVIPLPDKVDVKTGEEEEDVLYCHRAKLFRFVGGEWKERGLGDIKILKRRDNGKLRVVMRREQIFKICLNHILNSSIEYIQKDDKSWMFHTADYSEGEIAPTQFCVKFKTSEIAQEFKKAIADALEGSASGDEATASVEQESDDEVEIVSETTVTPEEEKGALRLGLPPKFFSYKQLHDCQCIQCIKDDEYLKELFAGDKKPSMSQSATSNWGTPKTSVTPSTGESVFGTPRSNLFTFTPQSATANSAPAKDMSLRDVLSQPLVFDEKSKDSPLSSFSFTSTFAQSSPNLFSKSTTTTNGNLFKSNSGGLFNNSSNLFNSPSSVTNNGNSVNIFGGAVTITPVPSSKTNTSSSHSISSTPTATSVFSSSTTSNKVTSSAAPAAFGGTSSIFGAKPVTGTVSSTGSAIGKSTNIFESTKSLGVGTTTSSPIFGGTTASTPLFGSTTATTPLFGGTTTTTTPLFGGITTTTTPLFGGGTTTTTPLFGGTTTTTTTPLFGGTTTTTTPLFGGTTTTTPLFGSTTNIFGSASKSLFGTTSTTTANVFGGSSVTTTTASLFGQNSGTAFGGGSIFSKPAAPSIFGSTSFGGLGTKSELGDGGANKSTTELKEDDELVLKCDTGLTFASLAANTSGDAAPAFSKKTGDGSFSFLGAGAPVFGSAHRPPKGADGSRAESDDEAGGDEDGDYDPHYEPIVPLPEAIVVTTGEENETALFNERAKLFRFDAGNKEWKERGVGQIKILHHPQNNTYRLLMRREQVYKVVLNQLIVPSLEIQPMLTSDKAWMWAGYNYTDDDNCLEKLAVRFKNTELAQKFHTVITETIQKVADIQNNSKSVPTSVLNYGVEEVSSEDPNRLNTAEDYEDYEDDEEEDDDDDDRSIMFMKRCTLSELDNGTWKQVTMGDLQIYYDQELYAARIAVNDDSGNTLSNTLIGINTIMDIDKKDCTWKAVEWAYGGLNWRTLKATFSSENAAQEFHSNYLEGINYAQQLGIVDEIPQEDHSPETDE